MNTLEHVEDYTYREIRWMLFRARTKDVKYDDCLREIASKFRVWVVRAKDFNERERFFDVWVHPEDVSHFTDAAKGKLNGILIF